LIRRVDQSFLLVAGFFSSFSISFCYFAPVISFLTGKFFLSASFGFFTFFIFFFYFFDGLTPSLREKMVDDALTRGFTTYCTP
jgi:hypothetical protein